jgi:hypothetical protein
VEGTALEVEGLARATNALLTSAESPEVLGSCSHIMETFNVSSHPPHIEKEIDWRTSRLGRERERTLGDDVSEELHGDTAGRRATDGDIEEDARVGHFLY